MFKRILVPTDFSEKSLRPLDIAVNIAEHYCGGVHLFHVVEIIQGATFDECEDFYRRLEKKARAHMGELMESFRDRGVRIEDSVAYGNRAQEILKYAEEHQADLIIMNSHRVDLGRPSEGWGTISYKVGMLCSCPILLVK
jgi:universal stress protein A